MPAERKWAMMGAIVNDAGGRVNAVACGESLPLSDVPTDRVVRIAGPSAEQLLVSLDPLPDGAPVVIRYRVPAAPDSPLAVVDDVLDRLEVVARELFPAWLPDARVIDTSSDFDRRVVREVARRMAATTEHFGPFVADVAEAALSGRETVRRFEPETRARGLARIIRDAYDRAGVVLLVGPAGGLAEAEQRRVAVACEWLADQGGFGVWLTGDALTVVDRFSTYLMPSADLDELSDEDTGPLPVIEYPALAGLPRSDIERTLARLLDRCEWAVGREWNFEYEPHLLAQRIRVDLMWQKERIVVEIDGPEHRLRSNYAADRRRDNGLLLDGFAVLRFTNEDVADDPRRVLATIESLLAKKRSDEGKLL